MRGSSCAASSIVRRDAALSRCRRYRYTLERAWDDSLPTAMFIGLNPSTADETTDDPTLRRCMGFARSQGHGGLVLANLFAIRATDPRELNHVDDPIGPDNDDHIRALSERAGIVIACWGNRGRYLDRDSLVASMIPVLHCLGLTKAGAPKHPLYLRGDARLSMYHSP